MLDPSLSQTDSRVEIYWRRAAYGFALVVALGLCYFLVRMPLQVSDDVANIMRAQQQSAGEILAGELGPGVKYFRPLLLLSINAAVEIGRASGRYFVTFKAIQVAQVVVLLLLFTRLLHVKSALDCSAACLAIVVAVGMHTFYSTVYELYPINTYMTILLCCVLALVLADGGSAAWRDVAAVALFVFALCYVETGVLVWVIVAVGYMTGFRGVSLRGVGGMTAVLILYVGLRFFVQSGDLPGLDERSAAFGFRSYNQRELVELFSDRRAVFYGANVVSSIVTIFFAEPRAGLWRFVGTIVRGEDMPLAMLLNVVISTASSLLIFWFVWMRRRAWLRLEFRHDDRLVLVFLAVAAANGLMSFPYTKDAIVSPAGLLFALAVFAGVRHALLRLESEPRLGIRLAVSCALALLSLGWTARAATVPYVLHRTAHQYQHDWVLIDDWIVQQGEKYDAAQLGVLGRMRNEALSMEVPNPKLLGWVRWTEPLFDRP